VLLNAVYNTQVGLAQEVIQTATTCAEVAQIHELQAEHKCTVEAAIQSVTERRLSVYTRDLHFFYRGQPEVRATLVALASGHHGYPPSMHDSANLAALKFWITSTIDGMYYLKDTLLASTVLNSLVAPAETQPVVAREALWELIPIATCLG
jgi:hypothetical protein